MLLSTVVTYGLYALIGFFAIKTIFYDFPLAMKTNSWRGYAVNVVIIAVVLGVLCYLGYLAGGFS